MRSCCWFVFCHKSRFYQVIFDDFCRILCYTTLSNMKYFYVIMWSRRNVLNSRTHLTENIINLLIFIKNYLCMFLKSLTLLYFQTNLLLSQNSPIRTGQNFRYINTRGNPYYDLLAYNIHHRRSVLTFRRKILSPSSWLT